MKKDMKEFTINSDDSLTTTGSMSFEITDDIEQLKIVFQVNNPAWIQIFLVKNNKEIGEALLTHQQDERIILVGKENILTSPTVTPQSTLLGKWEVIYKAKPGFSEKCDVVTYVEENHECIIDRESEIDIFEERHEDKKGWLKGDFHTHTHLSDGQMSRTENLESAKNQNLDFFFTTEHNVITRLWPKDDVIIFPGIELTSDVWGHCNYFGISQKLFSADGYEKMSDEKGMQEIIQQNQSNGILSINHPYLKPWEWNADIPLDLITSLELINDPTYKDNTEATKEAFNLWTRMWNKGVKITGIGGSDSHLKPDKYYPEANAPSMIGDPGTYVYVDRLNQSNVLEALIKGYTKVSRIGEIHLMSKDAPNILPGAQLESTIKHFEVQLADNAREYKIDWIMDGEIIKTEFTSFRSEIQLDEIDLEFHWLRADISDEHEILATFNPVYWNDKKVEVTMLKEVL